MTFLEVLLTILGAVVVGAIFYYALKATGPWGSFWTFFLILILVGLAAEAWITPIGPVYGGVAWASTLFVIILFALLLAAASPPRYNRTADIRETTATEPVTREEEKTAAALGVFFWIFFLFLVVAVIWGLAAYPA